ncbi:MAG TPA: GspE/PulE family protein, partial [Candidatus Paceibacterota bacterium]|nr:GspE/PulE family protein [Candidatus Paceibacterota bacterium]
CDIAEHRRPQDGRISLSLGSRQIDLRFSSVPLLEGEKIVLRVLGSVQRRSIPALEELGFSAVNLTLLKRIISTPNGVFFVTGPTGSGKTTTLYAILKRLNRSGINIMTVEDPVEYRLPGVNQVQVNSAVDLTFASALRSFLRQDPNVILVGEVRDMETAKIASQAALTGHLVLSTMHTNNALQAVTRLVEIGVEPFLVAPSIIGVSAQRLVRRLCPACRETSPMPADSVARYFGDIGNRTVTQWRGRGCSACGGSGYAGRIAIHEVFLLTDAVRRLIARNASILDIQSLALQHGFRPMIYDGLKKVLRGVTTLEEVERVTVQSSDA